MQLNLTSKFVLAEHSYLPSCKSASEFLWVVCIDLHDLVLKLLGVAYVECTSHKYDSASIVVLWSVPTNQRGLNPYKMLFRGAVAPIAPMVPPLMVIYMHGSDIQLGGGGGGEGGVCFYHHAL